MWTAIYVKAKIFYYIPVICGSWIGCYLNDGTHDIYVKANLSKALTDKVVAHEVGHMCGYKTEKDAQQFEAWANSGKSARSKEFAKTLKKCSNK